MKISKHSGDYTTDYVCCPKCYIKGIKVKKEIESDITLYLGSTKIAAIADFYNGLLYRMPLCCNIYFSYLSWIGIRLNAYIVYLVSDGSTTFDGFTYQLSMCEKEYVYKKLYERMTEVLENYYE